jgi:prolyl-tRNA synthetase
MSERLLGAVVGMHGDDNGLILPPSVAPFQVILMPVAAHADDSVIPAVEALADELSSAGIRVKIDDRDVRPGVKHYDWEIRGAPIRLELGPRDIAKGKCIISLRTGGKMAPPIDGIASTVSDALDSMADELRLRANRNFEDLVKPLPPLVGEEGNLEFAEQFEKGIVYEVAFDGNDSDAEVLEKLTGMTLLGDCDHSFVEPHVCVITGKSTQRRQYIARMY